LVADVAVDRATGAIRVQRITAAVDAGEVINPDGLTNQIEGGIIQALSWTLKEQVSFDQRRVTSVSWADYPILTFSEVPDIAIVLVETPGHGPLGVGEVSVPPVGAAVANAVASAVGVRLRDLPFTPERVRAAIAASSQLSP
jgi:CO/xanthine dehydrogenase Mo-binding subunit